MARETSLHRNKINPRLLLSQVISIPNRTPHHQIAIPKMSLKNTSDQTNIQMKVRKSSRNVSHTHTHACMRTYTTHLYLIPAATNVHYISSLFYVFILIWIYECLSHLCSVEVIESDQSDQKSHQSGQHFFRTILEIWLLNFEKRWPISFIIGFRINDDDSSM